MPISALPTPPSRSDAPQDFSDRADALLGALPAFVTEANALQSDVNAKEASSSSYATIATDKAAEAHASATTASTKASEAAASAAAAAAKEAEIGLPEIASYAALRAYNGALTAYYVRGVASIFDGGAGVFRVDVSDTTSADNGGTILVDAGGRRWKREFSGDVKAKWFGPAADGVTDDTTKLRAAVALSKDVDLEGASYRTDTLTLNSNQTIRNGTLVSFGCTGAGNSVLCATSKSNVRITDITIQQDSSVLATAQNRGVYLVGCSESYVDHCKVSNFGSNGIRFDGCTNCNISENYVLNCLREAEGSSDVSLAYGAIGIYGESNKSNRCTIRNNFVITNSSGISVAGGSHHTIEGNHVVANSSVSSLGMGIYCLETLTNLSIRGNFVQGFPNEGIDVHNTGTPRSGVARIVISNNICQTNSYAGISVVSSSGFEIADVVIEGNSIVADSTGVTFGFSHGVIVEYAKNVTVCDNIVTLGSATPTLASYGIYLKDVDRISVVGGSILAAFDQNIRSENCSGVTISGTTQEVKAGARGVLIATGSKSRFAITGNSIKGTDSTSVLIQKAAGGIALQFAAITGNALSDGTISIDSSQHLIFIGNMCNSLSAPSITDSGQGLISFNKGYLDTEAGTTKTSPGTVNQWMPVERNGSTYYIPMYTSKTT